MPRKPPEGWADLGDYYALPDNLEDKAAPPADAALPGVDAGFPMELHNITKETLTMTGWRTIIFGSILAVVGVLQTANWVDLLPAQYIGPVTAAIGFIAIWLRSITKTPVGVK